MLRYEEICQDFLDSAENSGLLVYGVHHNMDVITCDREFRCTCVTDDSEPPYQIRAEIGFTWDALLTAESNYGDEYYFYQKGIPIRSSFSERIIPGRFLELEIRICFETVNFEEAGVLARRIQHLVKDLIKRDNHPQIKFEVSILPEGRVVVHDSYINYWWRLDIQDEEIEFTPVCEEIRQVLNALASSSLFE